MSEYDYEETGLDLTALLFNILTVVVLIVTLCLGSVFALLLLNPQSDLNPYKPEPLPTRFLTFTPTPPPAQQLPPTFTPQPPTATREPTLTSTPRPSSTPTATRTPFVLISQTPVAVTSDASSSMPFVLRNKQEIPNHVHADEGCNWLGVAGQVFDMSGAPILGQTVEVGGALPGSVINFPSRTLTGLAAQYGPGGYEFALADRPLTSVGTLYVQLLDQSGTIPLSDQVFFDTFEDCDRNLILINFQQVRQP